MGFPGGSDGKGSACNAGDVSLIPGLGRSPGGGNGNSLQYFCLDNPMDKEAWWATVREVAKRYQKDQTSTLNSQVISTQAVMRSRVKEQSSPSFRAISSSG